MTATIIDTPLVAYAPMQHEDVATIVHRYLARSGGGKVPHDFQSTYNALCELWPSMCCEKEAFCLLAVDVYLQVAELEHFSVEPEMLKARVA